MLSPRAPAGVAAEQGGGASRPISRTAKAKAAWQTPRGGGMEMPAYHPEREISPRLAASIAATSAVRAMTANGRVEQYRAPLLPRIGYLS